MGFFSETESKWSGPFCFIQAADTQFGLTADFEKQPVSTWDIEIEKTKLAIEAANRMNPKPKFFIVCGDLINAMPADAANTVFREGSEKLRDPQINDFKKTFRNLKSDIPLVCVCGNHDVGDIPTHASVADYRKNFGDDYFTFYVGGVMCIVLNSQFYENCSHIPDLAKEQDAWLDGMLEEAKKGDYKHVVVFQHIPWFLQTPNEEKEYFNIVTDLRMKMLNKFYDAGIRYIFCGHYHRNAGGMFKDLELVVTSAIGYQLGTDTHGLRVVRVFDDSIKHHYYALEDVPTNIDLGQ